MVSPSSVDLCYSILITDMSRVRNDEYVCTGMLLRVTLCG